MSIHSPKLSVLILTYNEERHIGELLSKLAFADEIIVVDSFSTDKTAKIVQSFSSVKLIQNQFKNYADQRNFAIANATNDWVLFLDADERLSKGLKLEIIELFKKPILDAAYSAPIVLMFKEKKMRFMGSQSNTVTRLFNKNNCSYITDKLVHEKLKINGKIGTLHNPIIHYSYYDFEVFKKKMVFYGQLKAIEKNQKGLKYNIFIHIFHPIYTFVSFSILKLGFINGFRGFVYSYLLAFSVYERYKELKKLQQ